MVKHGFSLYYQNSFCKQNKQNYLIWKSIFPKIKLGGINLLMRLTNILYSPRKKEKKRERERKKERKEKKKKSREKEKKNKETR